MDRDEWGPRIHRAIDRLGADIRHTLDTLGLFLSHPISGFGVGLAFAVVAVVLVLFGGALIISGFDKAGRPDLPHWHPRRWIAPGLDFYVGLLLIGLDGALYGYFAGLLLATRESVPLWFGALGAYGCVNAVLAFKHFAQDRRKRV